VNFSRSETKFQLMELFQSVPVIPQFHSNDVAISDLFQQNELQIVYRRGNGRRQTCCPGFPTLERRNARCTFMGFTLCRKTI
jgi:hypothetical protein